MQVKQFYKPASAQEAVKLLADCAAAGEKAKILAGGTDLVIAMRERREQPDVLVDVSDIPEMNEIRVEDGMLHVGAACSFSTIEADANVLQYCPMLAQAASTVGAPTIRSRATVGGNVANAATAADSIPTLLAADACAKVCSAAGEKIVSVRDVVVGINKSSLAADELITELLIPVCSGSRTAFEKIGRRRALAISRINLGVKITLGADGSVQHAAVAVGAVGKTAYRVEEVESYLCGRKLDDAVIEEAAALIDEIVARNLNGRKTTPYKRKIAAAVLRRALHRVVEEC